MSVTIIRVVRMTLINTDMQSATRQWWDVWAVCGFTQESSLTAEVSIHMHSEQQSDKTLSRWWRCDEGGRVWICVLLWWSLVLLQISALVGLSEKNWWHLFRYQIRLCYWPARVKSGTGVVSWPGFSRSDCWMRDRCALLLRSAQTATPSGKSTGNKTKQQNETNHDNAVILNLMPATRSKKTTMNHFTTRKIVKC